MLFYIHKEVNALITNFFRREPHMKKNVSIYGWIMLASLVLVIAVTFIICLVQLSVAVRSTLFIADGVFAAMFTICPTMITRDSLQVEHELERRNDLGSRLSGKAIRQNN